MFISQVIFESEKENKAVIDKIMKKKTADLQAADGIESFECWLKEGAERTGFALVTKWSDKEYFKKWMKDSHKDGHKKLEIEITKTVYQFEMLD